mmetsp:Transcript_26605/g.60692  ORF Transcript_26605/g.60692 Transcript_26605/m.60692 type:complete len:278 (-) Transcript_26605:1167-2000(-)
MRKVDHPHAHLALLLLVVDEQQRAANELMHSEPFRCFQHRSEELQTLQAASPDFRPAVEELVEGNLDVGPVADRLGVVLADRVLAGLDHFQAEPKVSGGGQALSELHVAQLGDPLLDLSWSRLVRGSLDHLLEQVHSLLLVAHLALLERSLPHLDVHQTGRLEPSCQVLQDRQLVSGFLCLPDVLRAEAAQLVVHQLLESLMLYLVSLLEHTAGPLLGRHKAVLVPSSFVLRDSALDLLALFLAVGARRPFLWLLPVAGMLHQDPIHHLVHVIAHND